jgi:hypothetical protein
VAERGLVLAKDQVGSDEGTDLDVWRLGILDVRDEVMAMDDEVMVVSSLFAAVAAAVVAAGAAERSPCAVVVPAAAVGLGLELAPEPEPAVAVAVVYAVDAVAGRLAETTLVLRLQHRSSAFAAVVAVADQVVEAVADDLVERQHKAGDSLAAWPGGLVVAFAQTDSDADIADEVRARGADDYLSV